MLQSDTKEGPDHLIFPASAHSLWDCRDLDLYIRVMSEMKSDGHFFKEQVSPGIIFHAVSGGKGIVETEEESYSLTAGMLFVFWPDKHVKYYDFPDSPWQYTWFWMAGTKAFWIMENIGLSPDCPLTEISADSEFLRILAEVKKTFRHKKYSSFYPICAAWEIANALKKDLRPTSAKAASHSLAESCRIYIENNLDRLPEINILAKKFGVNRSTLYRTFRNNFNLSPKEYIDRIRFEKACRLLAGTQLSVKQIADTCGFEQACYFSYAFKQRFQESPTAWRQSFHSQ